MFEPFHPESHYTLHLHRARSVDLTADELVEIRAAQRTFEGAYVRTALGQFSFALVVLKIFTSEFYAVGALFAAYGTGILMIAAWRRKHTNTQFFQDVDEGDIQQKKFRTSGNPVLLLSVLTTGTYLTLMVLLARLVNKES